MNADLEHDVQEVQARLDEVARICMKTIGSRGLSETTNKGLAKFLYGLMNQRINIVERVRRRGPTEFVKVLRYVGRCLELLQRAERELLEAKTAEE